MTYCHIPASHVSMFFRPFQKCSLDHFRCFLVKDYLRLYVHSRWLLTLLIASTETSRRNIHSLLTFLAQYWIVCGDLGLSVFPPPKKTSSGRTCLLGGLNGVSGDSQSFGYFSFSHLLFQNHRLHLCYIKNCNQEFSIKMQANVQFQWLLKVSDTHVNNLK